jgi:transcriptional regulator with XRE-family HTH domain
VTVGQEIRRLREERGWSQAKLGVLSGVGPAGVSQIETGRRNPSAGTLQRIADALEVEVRDLFPKAPAPPPELPFTGLEDVRREVTPDAPIIKQSAATAHMTTTATAKPEEVQRILTLVWERKITPEEGTQQLLEAIA